MKIRRIKINDLSYKYYFTNHNLLVLVADNTDVNLAVNTENIWLRGLFIVFIVGRFIILPT